MNILNLQEKMLFKLSEEQNLRKVAESLYIFPTTPDKVEYYIKIMQSNSFDKYIHHCNIEIWIHTSKHYHKK